MHRKVWLNMGATYLFMLIAYVAPLIPAWKAAYVVQTFAWFLWVGFGLAFMASVIYYEGNA